MSTKSQKPVIFLAFANDRVDRQQYLRNLPEEARRLRDALEAADQAGQCEVVIWQNATLKDILDVFQRAEFQRRIAIFHFAGHANGYQLLLESVEGQPAIAHAEGLAHFLGQQSNLKLVFLNGCSTRPQVEELLAAQIPAVIATSQAIDDKVAMEFAGRLYKAVGSGADLQTAYQQAQAAIEIGWGSNRRELYYLTDKNEAAPEGWPWDLYLNPADEAVAQWQLPVAIQPGLDFFEATPRDPSFEPEMIYIPAGEFWMGSEAGEDIPAYETPCSKIYLEAYWIGKYPVTHKEYEIFVQKTGRAVAPEAGWDGPDAPPGRENHPVSGVTWTDAAAYCSWLRAKTGRPYTLPSEAQWEKAARGPEGLLYPWGNEWDSNRCNYGRLGSTPVDAYPEGTTIYGCYDMVGNVREWTRTRWGTQEPQPDYSPPWSDDARESMENSSYIMRVYRGGAAVDGLEQLRTTARNGYLSDKPGPRGKRHGFRVALKLEPE